METDKKSARLEPGVGSNSSWTSYQETLSVEQLAALLGNARREGRGWRANCPLHAGSLSIVDRNGTPFLTCWAGCDWRDVWAEINVRTGTRCERRTVHSEEKHKIAPENSQQSALIANLWNEAFPVRPGDLAFKYFRTRGLHLETIPESLRFSPRMRLPKDVALHDYAPAILARFDDPEGNLLVFQRIFLKSNGAKAEFLNPKRVFPLPPGRTLSGGAIRLAEPMDTLGLAEGVETALSCQIATGIPVWSCLSAGLIPSVVLPASVCNVIIFADHDSNQVGQIAAQKAAERFAAAGRQVKILIPPEPDQDWLDVYNQI